MHSSSTAATLSELVGQVANGDRSAFARVFEELWPIVRRFCAKMMQSDADADDAAQEAMMKIFTRAAEYDTRRPVLPWALSISAWECRTIMQKRRRRRETTDETAPVQATTDTLGALDHRDLTASVEAALSHLSVADRDAMLAAFWQLDDNAELSAPLAAAERKRKQRALERLRIIWRKLYGGR